MAKSKSTRNLVVIENNQALTTSLKIADYFERDHKNVMQAIETAIGQLGELLKNQLTPPFIKTTYTNNPAVYDAIEFGYKKKN